MSTIAVDVHDVTADLVTGFVQAYNKKHGATLSVEDVTDWDWRKVFNRPDGRDIFYELFTPELQGSLTAVPLAGDGIERLEKMGHKVVYATATYGVMADAVKAWLVDWSFLNEDEVNDKIIFAGNKGLVRADWLVDDKPENVEAFARSGGTAILFDRPWNRKFNWLRAKGWNEVVKIISTPILFHEPAKTTVSPDEQIAKLLSGVGPEVPATVNEHGGKQSAIPFRFDLVDPTVMFNLAQILAEGAKKYGEWNWRKIGVNDNLGHALMHIYAYLAGDTQDDHLGHALCRCMFAKSIQHNPDPKKLMEPAT